MVSECIDRYEEGFKDGKASCRKELKGKIDNHIEGAENFINVLEDKADKLQEKVDGAEDTISNLDNEIDKYKDKIKAYDHLIGELWGLV